MQTEYLPINSTNDRGPIKKAAQIIKSGGLLALPTETVYGLAANALDKKAVSKIFKAKGRPEDNPLIVHICKVKDLYNLAEDVDERVPALAQTFWPGPLTLVLKKKNIVPDNVSGGLDTVAVRMPNHPVALAIIEEAGLPLAAPSANASGSPSPTCALHVAHDMDGKIDAIVDSGDSEVGLESTVLSLAGERPVILRPGAVTREQLEAVIGGVDFAPAIFESLGENAPVQSPGMKYRHYAPQVA
ncbi:MAG TPA: L-threonylcarbamoyladenylate synthase, partial [Oscillospiraceae bacterium]|nr:L-threonylcarbamoyladenylate synthase [Oscillospiraceae bacterium]